MNNTDKRDFRDIFLLCILCGVLFCAFNQHFSKKKTKVDKHHEYVLSQQSDLILEKQQLKIPRLTISSAPELNKTNLASKSELKQPAVSEKKFLQIKILLKLNNYNLYYASGFHEPPLTV